jgi:hypothetical protein
LKFSETICREATLDFINLKLLSIVVLLLCELRRPSRPPMICMTRKRGGGESPGKGPNAVDRGGSFDHGSGAHSAYFVRKRVTSSLGNNGIAVFSPPGIIPENAALMK